MTRAPQARPTGNDLAFAYRQGLDRQTVDRLLFGGWTRADYRAYLQTDHWRAQKAEALEYWGRACCLCDCALSLQIHHRPAGYKHLFREDPRRHLIVVCATCHKHHHRR